MLMRICMSPSIYGIVMWSQSFATECPRSLSWTVCSWFMSRMGKLFQKAISNFGRRRVPGRS
jgi:hypothetical protein